MIITIIIFVVLIGVGAGIYFGLKKINKQNKDKEDILMDEFNAGKVILPIDKRDFNDFDEFNEKSKEIPSINDKMKTIDNDFENLKIAKLIMGKNDK